MLSYVVLLLAAGLFQVCHGQTCSADQAEQFLCDSQCNVAFCTEEGAKPIVIKRCFETTQKYCKANVTGTETTYDCTADQCVDPNSPQPFNCLQAGQFPSPFNCSVSYFCSGPEQPPVLECECGAGESFDLATGTCQPLNGECTRKPPVCEKAGDFQKWEGAEGYCYVCDETMVPSVMRCKKRFDDYVVEPLLQTCKQYEPPAGSNSTDSSTSTTTSSSSTTPSSNSTTTSPPTSSSPEGTCNYVNQRLADPSDCKKYFICDSALMPQQKTCPTGYFFNRSQMACTKGNCT